MCRSTGYEKYKLKNRWSITIGYKCSGKAIPVQDWTDHEGSRTLRAPEFPDNRHMKVVRLSAIRLARVGRKDYVNEKFQ
jgi:hypothetical protein